jgi:HK97 gp10 family phage protein
MARRSSVNQRRLSRLLRRAPGEIQEPVKEAIAEGLQAVALDMYSNAPVDEGDLRASISAKASRSGLSGVVGPGAKAAQIVERQVGSAFATRALTLKLSTGNRKLLFQYFKAYWIEFGTRLKAARPFVVPALEKNKAEIIRSIDKAVDKALERIARGF